MRTPLLKTARERLRDRSGVALPVTLFALIITSVLIAGLLVSSATEAAMSSAHQDSVRDLYAIEKAIESYVAQERENLRPLTVPSFQLPGQRAIRITVTQLFELPLTGADAGEFHRVFSIAGEPAGGGRRISVMVETGPIAPANDAAATFGGNSALGTVAWSETVR